MTEFSGAEDEDGFDGSTFLLECQDSENVHISGSEYINSKADDKVVGYISLMGSNMCL